MKQNQQSAIKANINTDSSPVKEWPATVPSGSKVKIFCWKVAGVISVGLAIIGAILPIMPTTIFLIMATACFAKSSPRMQKKLLENKVFGPLIHEWQQHRSIPRKAKRVALLMIALSVTWSGYLLQDALLITLVLLLVTWPVIFLWRMPESK